jgi:hypothetical protein
MHERDVNSSASSFTKRSWTYSRHDTRLRDSCVMTLDTRSRSLLAVGLALGAVASAIWLAVTANAISGGLVASDLALSPLVGLTIGAGLSTVMLALFVPASGALRNSEVVRRRLLFISTIVAVGLAAPVATVWLWNFHAHRLDSHAIEPFLEACLIVLAANVVAWLASVGVVRLSGARRRAGERAS